jgi:hypothetical protein
LARFWQQFECNKDELVERAMATTAAAPRTLLIASPRSKSFADNAGNEGSGEIGLDKLEASSRDRYLREASSMTSAPRIERAIALGWLGTCLKFTDSGATLFA